MNQKAAAEQHKKSREILRLSLEITRASIIHVIVCGCADCSSDCYTAEALCRYLHEEKNI